jgi:hypothetical protein
MGWAAVIALRFLAALSLTFLPGAWLAFGGLGARLPLYLRLAAAGALSPVIVPVQFYVLRGLGIDVVPTVWILVGINLLAVRLFRRGAAPRLALSSAAEWLFVLALLTAAASVPWFLIDQLRIFHSHAWMHSAIVPEFQRGLLIPEEPEIAGVRLAYPWACHVYWAVLGTILDWAPTRVYVLTNLIALVWTGVAIYAAGRAVGASATSSRSAVVWVMLGTNAAGAALAWITGQLMGDIRYTPWLRKYTNFNDMPFALALLATLVALAILALRRADTRRAWLFAAVFAGAGVVYPVIFPVAFAIAALVLLQLCLDVVRGHGVRRDVVSYGAALLIGTFCTFAVLQMTIVARTTSGFELSTLEAFVSKLGSSTIVFAPFLVAALVTLLPALRKARPLSWRSYEHLDPAHLLLLGVTAATLVAGAVFHLQSTAYNEYKLVLCAALTLGPFVAVALDRIPRPSPRMALVLSGLLLSPMALMQNPWFGVSRAATAPPAVEHGTSVHLGDGADESGWTNAIREQTAADTIVVVEDSEVFVPTATARSMYAPVVDRDFPGVWLESRNNLVDLRGYARPMVEARLSLVKQLFGPKSEAAWAELLKLRRPLAVLATIPKNDRLVDLLSSSGCNRIYQDSAGRVVTYCSSGVVDSESVQAGGSPVR